MGTVLGAQGVVHEMFNDTFVDAMDVGRWVIFSLNIWESQPYSYSMYANLGHWRDADLDGILWNSHLGSFVVFAACT